MNEDTTSSEDTDDHELAPGYAWKVEFLCPLHCQLLVLRLDSHAVKGAMELVVFVPLWSSRWGSYCCCNRSRWRRRACRACSIDQARLEVCQPSLLLLLLVLVLSLCAGIGLLLLLVLLCLLLLLVLLFDLVDLVLSDLVWQSDIVCCCCRWRGRRRTSL